eukprot:352597-Chlamydomonas_euryale.AAC.10
MLLQAERGFQGRAGLERACCASRIQDGLCACCAAFVAWTAEHMALRGTARRAPAHGRAACWAAALHRGHTLCAVGACARQGSGKCRGAAWHPGVHRVGAAWHPGVHRVGAGAWTQAGIRNMHHINDVQP